MKVGQCPYSTTCNRASIFHFHDLIDFWGFDIRHVRCTLLQVTEEEEEEEEEVVEEEEEEEEVEEEEEEEEEKEEEEKDHRHRQQT